MPDPDVMSRQYLEDAMASVKSYLDDNLKAKLKSIASTRDVTVPEPALISIGPDRRKLHPKIEVLPDTSAHDYGFEEQPLIKPWMLHTITLAVTHTASNVAHVQFTLLRYSEAINRLQEDDDTFGGAFTWVQIGSEDFSPMVESQQSRQVMQQVLIPLTCRTL